MCKKIYIHILFTNITCIYYKQLLHLYISLFLFIWNFNMLKCPHFSDWHVSVFIYVYIYFYEIYFVIFFHSVRSFLILPLLFTLRPSDAVPLLFNEKRERQRERQREHEIERNRERETHHVPSIEYSL